MSNHATTARTRDESCAVAHALRHRWWSTRRVTVSREPLRAVADTRSRRVVAMDCVRARTS